jgi:hypothetical protein
VLRWSRQESDTFRRVTALAVVGLILAGAMAVVGLPPVNLHGPLHHFGIMDPFCGGTRSVRLAARGDWAASWRYNPIGIPVLFGGALVVLRALAGRVTGHWLTVEVRRLSRHRWAAVLAAGALFAVLEVNQQAHAALLLAPR